MLANTERASKKFKLEVEYVTRALTMRRGGSQPWRCSQELLVRDGVDFGLERRVCVQALEDCCIQGRHCVEALVRDVHTVVQHRGCTYNDGYTVNSSSKGGESIAGLGIYDVLVVHSHVHMAQNDTSHYLCHFHAESSIFMRCTNKLNFIISSDDDSLLKILRVCHFNDLQVACKKPKRNVQITGKVLKTS